jgi:F-type H+-transporting ATPase subunit delta
MIGIAAAKRYADGFLEYAKAGIGQERALSELVALKEIFRDNPEIVSLLESPQMTYEEKAGVIDTVLRSGFSEDARNLLKLLLKKGRIGIVEEIADWARRKYAHLGETDAVLKVSYPLDTEILKSVKDALEKVLKTRLHLYVNIDPELKGGIKVAVGNLVFDGSTKKRLEDLKDKLMAVKAG